MLRGLALIAVALLCLGCERKTVESHGVAGGSEASEIYENFLEDWAGKERKPVNVSRSANPPSAEDLQQFSDCSDGNINWLPVDPVYDLTGTLGDLPYVRLVDPNDWKPKNPGASAPPGPEPPHESAVAHGLMTFSAIAFDPSYETAAFTYSFVCGGLCGNGGVAIFKKQGAQWIKYKDQCAAWIS